MFGVLSAIAVFSIVQICLQVPEQNRFYQQQVSKDYVWPAAADLLYSIPVALFFIVI